MTADQPISDRVELHTPVLPVSVLVQTKNEAASIERCIRALSNFGEVIVVDSMSDDGTARIAAEAGAQVVAFKWNGKYPKKKQWQIENIATRYDWILFLDADELPSSALVKELEHFDFNDSEITAIDLPLTYYFAGQELRRGHRVWKRALLRRSATRFPEFDDLDAPGMGELEGHYQPITRGRVVRARSTLIHEDLDPVSTWFDRHNRYSDWEAHLVGRPTGAAIARTRSNNGRLFQRVPFKPVMFFLWSYVIRGGILDGRAGFDYAFALSSYYWQIGLKVRERQRLLSKCVNRNDN